MKVYVTEHFIDYEGGNSTNVFAKEDDAKAWCLKEAKKEKENREKYSEIVSEITKLPHGFKYRDEGWIYIEFEVQE